MDLQQECRGILENTTEFDVSTREDEIMKYVSGDICYILEDNKYATKVKVMGHHGDECIVQRIGACGALRFKDHELFGTEEAALESRETTFAKVSPQLSVFPEGDNIPSIKIG